MGWMRRYIPAIILAQTILMVGDASYTNKTYAPPLSSPKSSEAYIPFEPVKIYVPKYLRPKRMFKKTLSLIPRQLKNDISILIEAVKDPKKVHWQFQD